MGLKTRTRHFLRDRGYPVPRFLLREKEMLARQVANDLTRADTVIDLGAHVGLMSQEFARRAGRVHAFEPNPATFRQLCHNTRNYTRITPINAGVDDRSGTAPLFFDATEEKPFSQGATLLDSKSNVKDRDGTEVTIVRLSDFILSLDGPVAIIKMDIEGVEYRVISDLLESPAMERICKVWVEPHEDRIPGLAEDRARVEARIAELGYADKFSFDWH